MNVVFQDRIINWIDNSIPNNDWDELHNAIKEIVQAKSYLLN